MLADIRPLDCRDVDVAISNKRGQSLLRHVCHRFPVPVRSAFFSIWSIPASRATDARTTSRPALQKLKQNVTSASQPLAKFGCHDASF